MKKFSTIFSITLVLASFFYGLIVISNDNKCTSVRKYSPECRNLTVSGAQVSQTGTQTIGVSSMVNTHPNIVREKTLDYALTSYILINTSSYFIGGYETGFDKIIDKGTYYEVVYSGKDNIIVDITKDKNKITKVTINGINLSENEITATVGKYYK